MNSYENHIDKAIQMLKLFKKNRAFVNTVSIDYGFKNYEEDGFFTTNEPDGTFTITIKGDNLHSK